MKNCEISYVSIICKIFFLICTFSFRIELLERFDGRRDAPFDARGGRRWGALARRRQRRRPPAPQRPSRRRRRRHLGRHPLDAASTSADRQSRRGPFRRLESVPLLEFGQYATAPPRSENAFTRTPLVASTAKERRTVPYTGSVFHYIVVSDLCINLAIGVERLTKTSFDQNRVRKC